VFFSWIFAAQGAYVSTARRKAEVITVARKGPVFGVCS
jgi:hypothetical protein